LRAAHPDEPWRGREDWAAGRVAGAGRRTVLGAWAFALVWCLVSAPILLLVPQQLWRLDVAAAVPGVDFEARFELPVFRTSASLPPGAPVPPAAALDLPPHPQTAVRATTRGGREFLFPPHRNPRAAVGLTAFWLIWSGAIWGLATVKAPLLFLLVFATFDLLLLAGVLSLWFGTAAIVCDSGIVTVRNSVLGIARTRSAPAAQVVGIDAPITMQTGDGAGTPYYSLRLRCRDGRTLDAGFELRDKREMEWLRAELGRAIGLGPEAGGARG